MQHEFQPDVVQLIDSIVLHAGMTTQQDVQAWALDTDEAAGVVSTLLEKGADPNVVNERNQGPLHLLCHNEDLRASKVFHEVLHSILFHGGDPNLQSLTGCTPLHLSLYHRDIDSAIQLISSGAELHLLWKKVRMI